MVIHDDDGVRFDGSSAKFRYDPNDLSMDDESGTAESAIKNLTFSTIPRESGGDGSLSRDDSGSGVSAASTTTRTGLSPDWTRADGDDDNDLFTDTSGAAPVAYPINTAVVAAGFSPVELGWYVL